MEGFTSFLFMKSMVIDSENGVCCLNMKTHEIRKLSQHRHMRLQEYAPKAWECRNRKPS